MRVDWPWPANQGILPPSMPVQQICLHFEPFSFLFPSFHPKHLFHPPPSSSFTLTRHPDLNIRNKSFKMGYDKTDELTINTIRVLAVCFHPSLVPRALARESCCPSISPKHHRNHNREVSRCSSPPPPPPLQNGQLLTFTSFLGRCDLPCQLGSPRCPHVRVISAHSYPSPLELSLVAGFNNTTGKCAQTM